jgi:hypothetical protein
MTKTKTMAITSRKKAAARSWFSLFCCGIFILCLGFNTGCGKEITITYLDQGSENDPNPDPSPTPPPGNLLSFASKVNPTLQTKCAGCHGSVLGSYSALMNSGWVSKGDASNSKLYTKMLPGQSMAGYASGTSLVSDVKTWIDQGALNN